MIDTAEIERQIQTLGHAALTGVVRQALGSATAKLETWQVQPITTGSGSATGGIYRIRGTACDRNERVDWSLMLKVIASSASVLNPASHIVGHPLYWKREVLAYQSGFLFTLPAGLEAPRCYDIMEWQDETVWLWLEEVREEYGPRWDLAQYARAAHALGQFNGAYLVDLPVPSEPWISPPSAMRGMLKHFASLRDVITDPQTWTHPAVRRAFGNGAPIVDRLLRLWADSDLFLDALDQLPQTLCHKDAFRGNMFAPRDPDGRHRLVLIDWAYVGRGELGLDAGDLFAASWHTFAVDSSDVVAFEQTIFSNYLAGLQDAGWHGEPELARFGYAAFAALKYGALLLWLPDVADERRFAAWEHRFGQPVDVFLEHHAQLVRCLLDLADEARALLPMLRKSSRVTM